MALAFARVNRGWFVLIVSGALGFRLGASAHAEWQVAVESAQVLAGVALYPTPTPASLYHGAIWSIVHQLLALLLRLGASETSLSVAVSGLLGMVSLQALAMFAFAFAGDVVVAVLTALVVLFSGVSDVGGVYPIQLLGTPFSDGSLGLSLVVLIIGSIGAGWFRSSAFLLGLMPAVHAPLGIWLLMLIGICAVWDRPLRIELRSVRRYLLAGAAVTAASLGAHVSSADAWSGLDMAAAATYLPAFVSLWDPFRQPVSLLTTAVSLNVAAFMLAAVWLTAFRDDVPDRAQAVLKIVVVASAASIALAMVSWIEPAKLPAWLVVLMPGRFLNQNAMGFVALLMALLALYHRRPWASALTVIAAVGFLMGPQSAVREWLSSGRPWMRPIDSWLLIEIVTVALVAMTFRDWGRHDASRQSARAEATPPRARLLAAACRGGLAILLVVLAVRAWTSPHHRMGRFADRTTDPLLRVAADGRGIMLTDGSLSFVQLKTRRPVLLDGATLRGLPYALGGAARTARILQDVYGIDFFNPPEEARRRAFIPPAATKAIWEGYSAERWRQIARDYQVTDVITNVDWSLALPVAAQSRESRLYHLPQ